MSCGSRADQISRITQPGDCPSSAGRASVRLATTRSSHRHVIFRRSIPRKPALLLQLLRPSLRSAVTAAHVVSRRAAEAPSGRQHASLAQSGLIPGTNEEARRGPGFF